MTVPTAAEPLVSVVLPAYNAGRYIGEALESVAAQRGPFRTEIIVVDDGSTDDTRAQAGRFPDVHLIEQRNAGPSAARNRGIAAARGEYVAFLDADDRWSEGKLAAQMAVFRAHPTLGLVFGDCRRFGEQGPFPQTFFEEAGLGPDFFGDPVLVRDPYAKLFTLNYIPTGAAVVRRQALATSGVFDESMRYVEDMDLWFRIAMHFGLGYTTHLCELKRQHGENVSNDTRVMDLAYFEVIAKQRRLYGKEIKRRGIPLAERLAYKYCVVGDRCERSGRKGEARHWYLEGLRAHPSLRPAYYLLRSLWRGTAKGTA
jgi:glycosyltransferase involved in cell wall biosynthesis